MTSEVLNRWRAAPWPRHLLVPAIAIVVGGLGAMGANRYIEGRIEAAQPKADPVEMVRVVVAAEDLAKGAALSPSNVAVRKVPKTWVHSNAILPDQFSRAERAELAVPAAKGEPLLWAQLEGQRAATFSARLAAGRRAITVPVDEVSSISGMLSPGDVIDIIVTVKHEQRSTMVPLLQAVRVLATGTRVETGAAEGRERSFTTVTLDVTPEDGRRVLAGRDAGKLTALLRAPGDTSRQPVTKTDTYAELGLLPERRPGRPASTVSVMYGPSNPRQFTVRPDGNAEPTAPPAPAPAPTAGLPRERRAAAPGAAGM